MSVDALAFFAAVLMGFSVGVLFDLLGVLGIGFKRKRLVPFFDLIFMLLLAFLVISVFYIFNSFELRAFLFVGVFLGLILYIFAARWIFLKIFEKIIKIFHFIFKILLTPARFLYKILVVWLFGKIKLFFKYIFKKIRGCIKNAKRNKKRKKANDKKIKKEHWSIRHRCSDGGSGDAC